MATQTMTLKLKVPLCITLISWLMLTLVPASSGLRCVVGTTKGGFKPVTCTDLETGLYCGDPMQKFKKGSANFPKVDICGTFKFGDGSYKRFCACSGATSNEVVDACSEPGDTVLDEGDKNRTAVLGCTCKKDLCNEKNPPEGAGGQIKSNSADCFQKDLVIISAVLMILKIMID